MYEPNDALLHVALGERLGSKGTMYTQRWR